MTTKSPKAKALTALLRLVERWSVTSGKRKTALQARISAANDRFYARFKRDGLAMLMVAQGRGK